MNTDAMSDHLIRFPKDILTIISEICAEAASASVWLVGSRANGRAKESSDWDVLVFSRDNSTRPSARHDRLDVIRVGPTGRVLVEGASELLAFNFSDFDWALEGPQRASYLGKKFREFDVGYVRNSSQPILDRTRQIAVLLHQNS